MSRKFKIDVHFSSLPRGVRSLLTTHSSNKPMFKQFIHEVAGADLYLMASLLTFFLFFVLVGVYLVVVSRRHLDTMREMPLRDDSTAPSLL